MFLVVKVLLATLSVAICPFALFGASNPDWTVVRSSHFEVYSHSGESNAKAMLFWLERLRAFFMQAGVPQAGGNLDRHGAVRVIGFRSADEYNYYRTQPAADAYFLSAEARDYLVLPELGSQELPVAAHEYAHLVLDSLGARLPAWLAEGMAEFFSTVRIRDHECFIGGSLPARLLALRQDKWIPLPALFSATSPMRANRRLTNMFYAESWLLTDMLLFSPAYAPHFAQLLSAIATSSSDPDTVARVYGKPLDRIMADAKNWSQVDRSVVPLPAIPIVSERRQISTLTEFESKTVLADLLLASGKLDEAETAYRSVAAEHPNDAAVHAALGNIALRKGHPDIAREQWKRALELGIDDARLCYNYAILAEDAGVARQDVRDALMRAIALKPDLDDARYKLGLLENNTGHYQAALEQFKSMHAVSPARAYAYWTAVATALNETDQRRQAKEAARKALVYATSADERASATQLAYVADTDLTVQFSRDANGTVQLVTARKPHGSDDWNPFVEASDHIVHLEGQIRTVECSAGKITGFKVASASSTVEVALPDPTHVLIRGGVAEFVCGAEDGRRVVIEYAASQAPGLADGILRGMRFE